MIAGIMWTAANPIGITNGNNMIVNVGAWTSLSRDIIREIRIDCNIN